MSFEKKDNSSGGNRAPGWFNDHLTRRQAGRVLLAGGGIGMAALTIFKLVGGDGEQESNYDSLELQKREGWNVGASDKPLTFGDEATRTGTVASNVAAPAQILEDPEKIISLYAPQNGAWQPFYVPTLLQSLGQPTLRTMLANGGTSGSREMDDAFQRAGALRDLMASSPDAMKTMVIVDLPGPASVAVGVAMADKAIVIPGFDNWPHPLGVVKSHETLGALLHYAPEFRARRELFDGKGPAILLLDSHRLTPYTDADNQFDNRWQARVPPATELRKRGVERIIYLVPDERQTTELDDLNDDFVEWRNNGLDVRMLRLNDFKPIEQRLASGSSSGGAVGAPVMTHYYGGLPGMHWLFFANYGMMAPRLAPRFSSLPAAGRVSYQPPVYQPVTRPTIFSATRIGGTSGVGRMKPGGFGQTSVRVSSGGRITGTRAGRSGSYGRGGGFSFGG
ncbi:MAG: hypothetical protein ACOYLN_05630 [Blastocatellia bacterium]